MRELRQRVFVITGGAQGIGRAIAELALRQGALVAIADVDASALTAASRALSPLGELITVRTDVMSFGDVEQLRDRVYAEFGRVDVLCNNAGVSAYGLTWELSLKDWQWLLGVNLWGTIHGVKAFIPRMLEQRHDGHVVNVASLAGLVSMPASSAYCASKHAVVAISETLQKELRMLDSRLHVSVICPSFVNTSIMDAEVRRPKDLQNGPGEGGTLPAARAEALRAQTLAGQAPADVARAVLKAIQDRTFYVFTGPEARAGARARFEAMLREEPDDGVKGYA